MIGSELARPYVSRPVLPLRHLAREASQLLRVPRVSIWRFAENGNAIECDILYGLQETLPCTRGTERGEVPRTLAHVVERIGSVIVTDTAEPGGPPRAIRHWIHAWEAAAVLILPIRGPSKLAGLMVFEDTLGPREWSVADRKAGDAFARQAGAHMVVTAVDEERAGTPRTQVQSEIEQTTLVPGGCAEDGVLERFLADLAGQPSARARHELTKLLSGMVPELIREAAPRLELHLAMPTESLQIDADAPLLEKAMIHLVRNAREASPHGSELRISWERSSPRLGTAGAAEAVLVRLEDQGEGIPCEHLPRVFDPFFTTRKESEGAGPRGLGLSVVQIAVEAHGGQLELTSRAGEGTVVEVLLPLSTCPSPQPDPW